VSYKSLRRIGVIVHCSPNPSSQHERNDTNGRATGKSGVGMQAMARGMERDARLMKFLSELTAFFLPLTAIAVGLVQEICS
jgi:hypothetical protein